MILCYGSVNPDLIHNIERFPSPGDDIPAESFALTYGGGGANVAVCLAAWGAAAALAGHTLGEDPLADWLLADLEGRGVDVALIERRSDSETPHTIVIVTPDGERTIIGSRYREVEWSTVSEETVSRAKAVVVDGYSREAGDRLAIMAGDSGVPVVGLDVSRETAKACRVVVWSRHEHAVSEVASLPTVIITDGPRPVLVLEAGNTWELTPPAVQARNAVGAGDAFGAMCALGTAEAWSLEDTVRRAAAAGALVAASDREDPPPALEEVEELAKTLLT
ncbi:MAG: carbohydrate kinase family protein [Acidimicrobiia bacterium]